MSSAGSTAGRRMRRARSSAREAEDAADLDELAVDGEDRAGDAEIDREEDADRDQRHLRGLEDAEPQDEQRHPGDRRDGAQRLEGRIEEAARRLDACRTARRAAMPAAAPRPKPTATAPQRRPGVGPQLAGLASAIERRGDPARRRHQPAFGEAGAHGDLPAERERERQDEPRAAQFDARRATKGRRAGGGAGAMLASRLGRRGVRSAIKHAHRQLRRRARDSARSMRSSTAAFTSVLAGSTPASLKREAGGEDRFPLRLADDAVGELGAGVDLAVDHGRRQLGEADEGLLQRRRVGERPARAPPRRR